MLAEGRFGSLEIVQLQSVQLGFQQRSIGVDALFQGAERCSTIGFDAQMNVGTDVHVGRFIDDVLFTDRQRLAVQADALVAAQHGQS